MAWWWTVELDRDVTPAFPDTCIVCGATQPDGTLTVRANSTSPLPGVYLDLPGLGPSVHVPACTACASRVRWRSRLRQVVEFAGWPACVVAFVLLFRLSGRSGWMLATLFGTAAWVIVVGAAEINWPDLCAIVPRRWKTEFKFRDRGYAELVAELNGAEVAEAPHERQRAD